MSKTTTCTSVVLDYWQAALAAGSQSANAEPNEGWREWLPTAELLTLVRQHAARADTPLLAHSDIGLMTVFYRVARGTTKQTRRVKCTGRDTGSARVRGVRFPALATARELLTDEYYEAPASSIDREPTDTL